MEISEIFGRLTDIVCVHTERCDVVGKEIGQRDSIPPPESCYSITCWKSTAPAPTGESCHHFVILLSTPYQAFLAATCYNKVINSVSFKGVHNLKEVAMNNSDQFPVSGKQYPVNSEQYAVSRHRRAREILGRAGLILLVFALLIAACSPARAPETVQERAPLIEAEAPGEEVGALDAVSKEGGIAEEPAAEEPALQAPADDANLLSFQSGTDRMVIKDALIDLLVSDTDRAVAQVTQLAAEQGGYIIDARSWQENSYKFAELKLGVPVNTFEHTLNVLRDLGLQVTNETVSGQDVSAEYNDLQSSLTNLQATADRVRGFLDQAKTIDEALTINATLAELEAQIEQVKGQMHYYEGRSAFSTVTVRLSPQIIFPTPTPTPTPTPPRPWDPGRTFRQARAITVRNAQHFIDSMIWFVVIYWPVILIGIAGALVLRKAYRKSKAQPVPPTPSWQQDSSEPTSADEE